MPKKIISSEPELPHISASMRAVFKKCRYQWSFRYVRRLETKISSSPLRFGTLVHTALEQYYVKGVKRGPHPVFTFEAAYNAELKVASKMGFKDEEGTWLDALALGMGMLEHYVDTYGADKEWKVLATEATFEQPVYDSVGIKVGIYVGVLDLVMLHIPTNQIWFWDHKTAKTIETSHFALDDQSSGYWTYGVEWLRSLGVLKPGQDLMGIKFNILRKAIKDDRPQNAAGHYTNLPKKEHYLLALTQAGAVDVSAKMTIPELEALAAKRKVKVLGDVSATQPSAYFERFTSYRGEAEREHTRLRVAAELREIAMVKAGQLDLLKTPDKMGCRMCDVRDICELHESGADWEEMMRLIMVPRRPMIREAVDFEHEH